MPIPLAAVAVGLSVAQAAGAFTHTPDMPDPRNYAQETRDTLQAKIDLAPQQFATEAKFRPLYDRLNLGEYERTLLGSPAGSHDEYYTEMEPYDVSGTGLPFADADRAVSGAQWANMIAQRGYGQTQGVATPVGGVRPADVITNRTAYRPVTKTRTVQDPAQRGLLDLYEQDIAPRLAGIQTKAREADINDIQTLGPKEMEAMRAANPGASSIVDSLVNRANANLQGGLDPAEDRALQQSVRGAQAARGVGYGPTDIFDELVNSGVQGQEIIRNRAAQALAASQGFYGNPFETILQRNSGANAGNAQGQALALNASSGTPTFDPESPYAADIYNTNFNAQSAAAISARNNQAAILGSLIGGAGRLGGAYIGAL
jgi:hypothetical protein